MSSTFHTSVKPYTSGPSIADTGMTRALINVPPPPCQPACLPVCHPLQIEIRAHNDTHRDTCVSDTNSNQAFQTCVSSLHLYASPVAQHSTFQATLVTCSYKHIHSLIQNTIFAGQYNFMRNFQKIYEEYKRKYPPFDLYNYVLFLLYEHLWIV